MKGYHTMPDVTIVSLPVAEAGVVYGLFHEDEQFVEWLEEGADLAQYAGQLLFKVNRNGERVVVQFACEDLTHPAVGYKIDLGHHEPFKVVMLAGFAVRTILSVFEPMNYASQLGSRLA